MNELETLKQSLEKDIGVSCLCGTIGCTGRKCNSAEFRAVLNERIAQTLQRKVSVTPKAVWDEFLRNAAADAGITTMENFLGSVKKYEELFLEAASQLEGNR